MIKLTPDDANVLCARGARRRAFAVIGVLAVAALLLVALLGGA